MNFQEALTYPLCSVRLSPVFPDGIKPCTSKNKLTEIIVSKSNPENTQERSCKTLAVVIAQFRTISKDIIKNF